MLRDDELWILLRDPHEVGEVDGAWGAAIAHLSAEDSTFPWLLTEPRIAATAEVVVPGARIRVSLPDGPCRRLEESDSTRAGLLDLLFLRDRLPSPERWKTIRSFGLRAAVLGCAVARVWKRPHVAFLADPIARVGEPLERLRTHRSIRTLEGWVVSTADRIETPDPASAGRLEEVFLSPPGRIVPSALHTVLPMARRGEESGRSVAILASTRRPRLNDLVLDAIARLRPDDRFRIHWLARHQGYPAMRARQRLRQRDLARYLCWEEDPWIRPIPARSDPWTLLLVPDPRPGAWPLLSLYRAAGGRIVAPKVGRRPAWYPEAVELPWVESSITEFLDAETSISRTDQSTTTAMKGGE